jgi:hypothetical protein
VPKREKERERERERARITTNTKWYDINVVTWLSYLLVIIYKFMSLTELDARRHNVPSAIQTHSAVTLVINIS